MNKRIKKKKSTIEKYRGVTAKKLRRLLMNRDDILPYLLHDESNNVQFSNTKIPYWIDKFKKYDIFYVDDLHFQSIHFTVKNMNFEKSLVADPYSNYLSYVNELVKSKRIYYAIPSSINPNKNTNYKELKKYPCYFWSHPTIRMITLRQGHYQMTINFSINESTEMPLMTLAYHPYNLPYLDGKPIMLSLNNMKIFDSYVCQHEYLHNHRIK